MYHPKLTIDPRIAHRNKVTVAELKQLLDEVPDDYQVVIDGLGAMAPIVEIGYTTDMQVFVIEVNKP